MLLSCSRTVPEVETEAIRHLLVNLFSCEIRNLPTELLTNRFMKFSAAMEPYYSCLKPGKPWEHICNQNSGITQYCAERWTTPDSEEINFRPSIYIAEQNGCFQYLKLAHESFESSVSFHKPPKGDFVVNKDKLAVFYEHVKCVWSLQGVVNRCLYQSHLYEQCLQTKIRAVKILRLKMPFIEPLLRNLPAMTVVYYVRDPRAIVNSRIVDRRSTETWLSDVVNLCGEMQLDLDEVHKLQVKYPDVILMLRYEDLVDRPSEVLHELYGHFSEVPSKDLEQWLYQTMHAEEENGKHGVQRTNASKTQHAWRENYPADAIDRVSRHITCQPLLASLGYI